MPWLLADTERTWLAEESQRLLAFGSRARHTNGFAWLDARGEPFLNRPVELWVTARMTHCFALGQLLREPTRRGRAATPACDNWADLVEHGLASLTRRFHDIKHGGWYASLSENGPANRRKETYGHAFVVLAAASALTAGHDSAQPLLADALECFEQHLWSEPDGMVVDAWDESFDELDTYRGLNANMHTVEAFLAASDATSDPRWRDRALRISERVLMREAPRWQWRLPEHYDASWNPIPGYNRNRQADPFRPYGATVGHGLEWSRLALNLEASLAPGPTAAPAWLAESAVRLLDRAVTDGWAVDGADGFVYTTDWDGSPVVHHRMHWVVAEATAAAAALARRTGEERHTDAYRRWWDHIRAVFIDPANGSWHHELDRSLRPSATVWEGKPDIYHALQATLIPRLPVSASIAGALHRGPLD